MTDNLYIDKTKMHSDDTLEVNLMIEWRVWTLQTFSAAILYVYSYIPGRNIEETGLILNFGRLR